MTTVLQTMTDAMVDAGLLMEGATPTTDQQSKYLRRLNDILELWQTQGLKLWLERDTSVTLVAGTSNYTVTNGGARVMRITQAYWLSSAGNRTPVNVISREEYTRLSNTTNTGAVTSIFAEKLVTSTKVWTWLVPDATAATGTLHVIGQVTVPNFTLTSDDLTLALPKEWGIPLRWGLADEICTGQPESIMQRCAQKAAVFREALENWDVEDTSMRFEAAYPGSQPSSFR
tara:strand:- start:1045 stop:1734 length:690 start_codon:yes stop_codon:yes gene_type:complete